MMTLAENIKMYREKEGITQKDLAESIGFDPNAVSNWERGVREPDIATLKAIAKKLNATLAQLTEEKPKYPKDFLSEKTLNELLSMSDADLSAYLVETQELAFQCNVAGSMPYDAFQYLSKDECYNQVLNAVCQFPTDLLAKVLREISSDRNASVVSVRYVSVWDGGSVIETDAKYDAARNVVFDVETAEAECVSALDDEYILFADGSKMEVVNDYDEYAEQLEKKEVAFLEW